MKTLRSSIIFVLTILTIITTSVFAQNETNDGNLHHLIPKWLTGESPLRQYRSGISENIVVCKEDLQLIIKIEDNSPACVKPQTIKILVERGWAKNPTLTLSTFLEQSYNGTRYKNGTMIDSYTIDVKINIFKDISSVLLC